MALFDSSEDENDRKGGDLTVFFLVVKGTSESEWDLCETLENWN